MIQVSDYLQRVQGLRAAASKDIRMGSGRLNYNSLEHFVLRRGVQMNDIVRQESWPNIESMPVRECFRNATLVALREGLIYCEGFAMGIFPVLHAWNLTQEGRVIDTTWAEVGTDYYGCAVKSDFLRKQINTLELYGLIDQPGRWPLIKCKVSEWQHPIMRELRKQAEAA